MATSKSQWQKLRVGSYVWSYVSEWYKNEAGQNEIRTVIRNGIIERFSAGMGVQAEINWGTYSKWHGRLSIDGIGKHPHAIND